MRACDGKRGQKNQMRLRAEAGEVDMMSVGGSVWIPEVRTASSRQGLAGQVWLGTDGRHVTRKTNRRES